MSGSMKYQANPKFCPKSEAKFGLAVDEHPASLNLLSPVLLSVWAVVQCQLFFADPTFAQGPSMGPPGVVRYTPPGVDPTSTMPGMSGGSYPGMGPSGMTGGSYPGMSAPSGMTGGSYPGMSGAGMSPVAGSIPGLGQGFNSYASQGTIGSGPQAGAGSGATPVPTAGFAGLKSRSGINPADLPTSMSDPRAQKMLGMVPKFTPDFFRQMQATQLPAATVLTAILDNDISSNKSKPGDIFVLRLEDGFVINGMEMIPKQSKILGTITEAVSSHAQRTGGHPGQLTISLQTLVFPDGRTCPFWGFVEHNPLHDPISQSGPTIKQQAASYSRYGYSIAGYLTKKVGYNLTMPNFGQEMQMKKGEVLPIKTNRPIDLTHMTPPTSQIPMPPGAVPNLNGFGPQAGVPGIPGMPMGSGALSGPGAVGSPGVPTSYIPGLPSQGSQNFMPGVPSFSPPGIAGGNTPGLPSYAPMNAAHAASGGISPYPSEMDPF